MLDLLYSEDTQIDPSRFTTLERTATLLEIDLDALSVDLSSKQKVENEELINVGQLSEKPMMSKITEEKDKRSELPGIHLAEQKYFIRVTPMRSSKVKSLAERNCLDKIPVSAACQSCHRLFVIGYQLNEHENLCMQKEKKRQQDEIGKSWWVNQSQDIQVDENIDVKI